MPMTLVEKFDFKNLIFILFILCCHLPAYAVIEECGEYEFSGIILEEDEKIRLTINQGSLSGYSIKFNSKSYIKSIPYKDTFVKGKLKISKITSDFKSEGVELLEIETRIPNPLLGRDQFLQLKKKSKCL
jgi:hypothetical protein